MMNGGGHFVPSACAALCSLCIQCAEDPLVLLLTGVSQSFTVIGLGDCFALTNASSNVVVVAMVWPPVQAPSPRRLWDPGVWSTACPVNTSRRWSAENVMMARHFVSTMMPVTVTVTMQSFDFWLINNTVSLVEFHPGIASSVSVFHCCHPVLSRPAVPNVDT